MKKQTMAVSKDAVVIRAVPEWKSADGLWCIVRGVYPEGMIRSLTRPTMAKAMKIGFSEVQSRGATSEPAYAVVPTRYILEGTNDLGEVAP